MRYHSFTEYHFAAGTYAPSTYSLGLISNTVLMGETGDTTVLDAEQTNRLFSMSFRTNVVLKDISVINGLYSNCKGGGIYSDASSLSLINCKLENNALTRYDWDCMDQGGGGIYARNTTLTIQQSIIRNNRALNWQNSGGGIWSINGSLQVSDTLLEANRAGFGAGLALGGTGAALLFNIQFLDNQAQTTGPPPLLTPGRGGAMNLWGDNCTVSVLNALFVGNDGDYYGGAFNIIGSYHVIQMQNCTFTNNYAGTVNIWNPDTVTYNLVDSIQWTNYHNNRSWNETTSAESTLHYLSALTSAYAEQDNSARTDAVDRDVNPLFVMGPCGAYYLSSIEAGQSSNSPFINAGSANASEVCDSFTSLCMSQTTTRTDEVFDTGLNDAGYHYFPGGMQPTPSPTPTSTPVPPVPTSSPFGLACCMAALSILLLKIRNQKVGF